MPPDRIKVLLDQYQKFGEKIFSEWLQDNKIKLLLVGQKTFTSFVGDPPNINTLIKNDSTELNDIARSLSLAFLEFLEQGDYLNKNYDCQLIPNQNSRLKVCISKSLEKKTNDESYWNSHLDDLPSEQLLELVEQYRIHRENLFMHWIEQNQIPFFLVGIRPFIKNIEITPPLEKLTESKDIDLRSFAKSLGTAYMQYLRTNQILNQIYDSIELPNHNPRLKIYTLKSLGLEKPKQFLWNSRLQKVATDYEMEQSRPLPNWIKNLDEENQKRLLEKRAGTLYGELELESESLSIEKKYERLRKILELDPNHSGAKQDIEGLKEDSEKTEIRDPPDKNKAKNSSKIKTPSEQMFDLFKKANDQMESRNWLEAQKLLNKGLKIDPTHVEMLKDLDIVNKELENLQKRNP